MVDLKKLEVFLDVIQEEVQRLKGNGTVDEGTKPDLITTTEAAERLHMKAATLARKLSAGELTGVKVGRQWLIRKDLVDAMLEPPAPRG
jgi:excisionase family DNA binding protein